MFPRSLASSLLLVCGLIAPVSAQSIDGFQPREGTLGTVIRVSGADFPVRAKFAFVEAGQPTSKAHLVTVAQDHDSVDVRLVAARAGSFALALLDAQGHPAVLSTDLFEVRKPIVVGVEPASAVYKDEVDLLVEFAGTGATQVHLGGKKAKVLRVSPVAEEGFTDLSRVTVRVPKVADGIWDFTFRNRVQRDLLPLALEVTGGATTLKKSEATVHFQRANTLKVKNKGISMEHDSAGLALVVASKKQHVRRVLRVTLPLTLDQLVPGQAFTGEPAEVTFVEGEGAFMSAFSALASGPHAGWHVDVNAVGEQAIALLVEGELTRVHGHGAEVLGVEGRIVVQLPDH